MITDKKTQTEISEVFSSLQGEGPYLGVQQIFIRFGRCNMHCGYCDELEKMKE
jgi:organic radical activating enzyme